MVKYNILEMRVYSNNTSDITPYLIHKTTRNVFQINSKMITLNT